MFRLEIFCEDAKLPRIMHALNGLVLADPKIQPVANAEPVKKANGGTGAIVAKGNGNALDMFRNWLIKSHVQQIRPSDVKTFMRSIGRSEGSYSLLISEGVKAKLLKREPAAQGNKSFYHVNPGAK